MNRYASPEAFKQALEQRLRTAAGGGSPERGRQLLVFDRFLARITSELADDVVLKGGLVLERRLDRARTTKDVDLRMIGPSDNLLATLRRVGLIDLDDHMRFDVVEDREHPIIDNDGMRYDGFRFRAQCRLAGKQYALPFGVDIAFGDPIFGAPDVVVGNDVLAFAGVAPPTLRLYPIETHLAEKLHAYTMQRTHMNSRVKDLPDIALLATTRAIDAHDLRAALEQTFAFRATHPLPATLPAPPDAWRAAYAAIARDDRLQWASLDEVFGAAQRFLDPVLTMSTTRSWSPLDWRWS